MVHHEIANADRARAALAQDTLERAPGVPSAMRYGPMKKEKINLVQSELTMACIEGARCLVIAVIASGPHTKTGPGDH